MWGANIRLVAILMGLDYVPSSGLIKSDHDLVCCLFEHDLLANAFRCCAGENPVPALTPGACCSACSARAETGSRTFDDLLLTPIRAG